MDKYAILLGYFDKQLVFVYKIYEEITTVDLHIYDKRFLFAIRVQQFYTAIEDLFKQVAKAFENHIENMTHFHKELLLRVNTEIPGVRPLVIGKDSLSLLDKLRSFRHFIRHAYDCELDEKELKTLQEKLKNEWLFVKLDFEKFRSFLEKLL